MFSTVSSFSLSALMCSLVAVRENYIIWFYGSSTQGFKVSRFFISPHTWYTNKTSKHELKSKVGRMEPPGNPGQFNNEIYCNKRFPITPDGVLGVAPYLLFTSVLVGTIYKYKK